MKTGKLCYQVREIDTQRPGQGGTSVMMLGAFSPDGGYIGNQEDAYCLVADLGIYPERADPNHDTCSIGFCPKEQTWYGWSHRARSGFGIGDTVKKGDAGYTGTTPEEMIEDYGQFFADVTDDPEKSLEIVAEYRAQCGIAVDRTGIFIGTGEEPRFAPLGRGEWTAETLEDAKQMAKDFAESVS